MAGDGKVYNKFVWLAAGLLFLGTLLLYQNVRFYDFVNFDDVEYLLQTPQIEQGLSFSSVGWAFTTLHMANWHPLTWLSYLIDYELYGGFVAGGFHTTNVLLHALNAVFLFFLILQLTGRKIEAYIIAILFAIHPTHVESVAWISERKDVLSTLFFLLTIWVYALYTKRENKPWYYVGAVLLYAAGLMTKPMLVTLPFVLLLLDYYPLQRTNTGEKSGILRFFTHYFRRDNLHLITEKIPFFVLTVISVFVTVIAQSGYGAINTHRASALLIDRIQNAILSYGKYIWLTFYPHDLAIFYPYPQSFDALLIAGIGIGLVAIAVLALRYWRTHPYIPVGWFFFVGTLVPVIGLMQVGSQAMADRYVYIPHIGLFFLIVLLASTYARKHAAVRYASFIIIVFAVVFFVGTSWKQIQTWENNETLYLHAIDVTASNHTANANLAVHYILAREYKKALPYAEAALRVEPGSKKVMHNLGSIHLELGEYDLARQYYKASLSVDSTQSNTHGDLAKTYMALDSTELAEKHLLRAVELEPTSALHLNNLGSYYLKTGRADLAIEFLTAALKVDPDLYDIYNNFGLVFLDMGKYDQAKTMFQRSTELRHVNSVAHKYLGDINVLEGKYDSALVRFSTALSQAPGNEGLHNRIRSLLVEPEKYGYIQRSPALGMSAPVAVDDSTLAKQAAE